MPNILAQLPASLKERVSISRENADDDEPDIEVASDVECYINPESDLITLDRGVGARFSLTRCTWVRRLTDLANWIRSSVRMAQNCKSIGFALMARHT